MGKWMKTSCNMCGASCGLEMDIENNQIISVRPDKDNPRTEGYCCRKGRAAKYYQDHSDRLDYPLKRVGKEYARISWEQAYNEIAEKLNAILEKHGPRSLAVVGCALAANQTDLFVAKALMSQVGTQYYYNPIGLEFMGVFWAYGKIIGRQLMLMADHDHAEVYILWGCNAYVSHQMNKARTDVREISEDPERMLISVDPRLSETARIADMHIMLRPGADALLVRAMIALILKEGWQDQAFLDKWVSDYDKVAHWFDNVDIEESCRVAGVPYETVREFCKILTTRKCCIHQDLGIYMGRHNTISSYLLIILSCICGSFLTPGGSVMSGGYFPLGPFTDEDDPNVWRTVATNWAPVSGAYPAAVLSAEIMSDHPERLRAVITSKSNPVRSFPDSAAQEEAFSKLELLVCLECAMTETARLADYVLPAKTAYEGNDFSVFQFKYPESYAQLKKAVIESRGERKEDSEIWLGIADAMGIIPPIPDSLYEAAEKKTRMEYFGELMAYLEENPSYKSAILLIVGKTMGKAMGSVTQAIYWILLMTSELVQKLASLGNEFTPGPSMPDQLFEEVMAHGEDVLFGRAIDDISLIIDHPDKKIHFYAKAMDDYIKNITPEKEAKELLPTKEYPLVISSGTHADGGVNNVMRNPATYKYRKPWCVLIHPEDAKEYGIKDGQMVKLTTEAASVEAEAEYTYRASKGYLLLPHHYGLHASGQTNGVPAGKLSTANHIESVTGNPIWRYIPCRVEAV